MKNNMMNTFRKRTIWATVSGLVLLGACKNSFLEVPTTGVLDQTVLTTSAGLETVLIGAYAQVNGRDLRMASPSNWVWGSIRGGEANKGTDPGDYSDINPIQRYETLPTSGIVSDKWKGNYEGVSHANNLLRLVGKKAADVSDADAKSYTAQARFLRGHFYFELKRAFGNTPYVDETVDYGQGIESVKNDQDLWPKIIADFRYAVDNLPATQAQVGKVNSWAAKAYLGKVYMYTKKYDSAKILFDDCIANGVTSNNKKYALVPKYSDLYKASNDNNSESIWAYQAAANTGSINNANPEFDLNWPYNTGPNGPGNCCSFFQPTFEQGNVYRTVAGLPLIDGSYNTGANQLVTDMGLASTDAFTPDGGTLDPRLDHTIGRRYVQYLDWIPFPGKDWIRNQPNAGPYETKKYVYYKSDVGSLQDNSSWTPGYAAMNYTIIRLADVMLMLAEAEIEVGDPEKARALVNLVRTRAQNPADFVMGKFTGVTGGDNTKPILDFSQPAANYVINLYTTPFAKDDVSRQKVRMERRLELGEEGHRFFDLVRWGDDATAIPAYIAYESTKLSGALGGAIYTPVPDRLLPLPQDQIDLVGSDILQQNDGF